MSHIKGSQKFILKHFTNAEEYEIKKYLDNLSVGDVVCTKEIYEHLYGQVEIYRENKFARHVNEIIRSDNRFVPQYLYTIEYGKQRCFLKQSNKEE